MEMTGSVKTLWQAGQHRLLETGWQKITLAVMAPAHRGKRKKSREGEMKKIKKMSEKEREKAKREARTERKERREKKRSPQP
jgi:hypothetical protein